MVKINIMVNILYRELNLNVQLTKNQKYVVFYVTIFLVHCSIKFFGYFIVDIKNLMQFVNYKMDRSLSFLKCTRYNPNTVN